MNRLILILEDNKSRLQRFRDAIAAIDRRYTVISSHTADGMIEMLNRHINDAALISLDHDLYSDDSTQPDPGDGLEVAKYLAQLPPTCPVIVHSSNSDRAMMMVGEFELGGWLCKYIAPLGDDWIESFWAVVVRKLLTAASA